MKERKERDSGEGNRNPFLKSQATITNLSDLGVSKQQAYLWQLIATIPETEFERLIGVAVGKAARSPDF